MKSDNVIEVVYNILRKTILKSLILDGNGRPLGIAICMTTVWTFIQWYRNVDKYLKKIQVTRSKEIRDYKI